MQSSAASAARGNLACNLRNFLRKSGIIGNRHDIQQWEQVCHLQALNGFPRQLQASEECGGLCGDCVAGCTRNALPRARQPLEPAILSKKALCALNALSPQQIIQDACQ
jgi:ferredoxin